MTRDDQPSITILGPGQMGLCCATILAGPDPSRPDAPRPAVRIWGHDEDEIGDLSQTRASPEIESDFRGSPSAF